MYKETKRKYQVLTIEQIKQIAKEYGRTKGPDGLGKELGVSKQRIQQVACRLRKEGVKIPRIRGTRYGVIVAQLKVENPELF